MSKTHGRTTMERRRAAAVWSIVGSRLSEGAAASTGFLIAATFVMDAIANRVTVTLLLAGLYLR